jgi:hypothetical protein
MIEKQWSDYFLEAEKALNITHPKYLTMEDYKAGMQEAHELLRKARQLLEEIFLKHTGL